MLDRLKYEGIQRSKMSKAVERERLLSCFLCQCAFGNGIRLINSHTIKEEVLLNVCPIDDGTLWTSGYFDFKQTGSAFDLVNRSKISVGANEAGTFKLVCGNCDQGYFREYEDRLNSTYDFSQNDMAQIALKTSLFDLSRVREQISRTGAPDYIPGDLASVETLPFDLFTRLHQDEERITNSIYAEDDLREIHKNIDLAKLSLSNYDTNSYYKLMDITLDYTAPIAAQSSVVVRYSPDGRPFQDINKKGRLAEIFVCFFPNTMGHTRILVFCSKKESKLISTLRYELSGASEAEKMKYYYLTLLIGRSDGFYISKLLESSILNSEPVGIPIFASTFNLDYKYISNKADCLLQSEYQIKMERLK